MNVHGFAGDKQMLMACVQALREREDQLGSSSDGPTAEELQHMLCGLERLLGDDESTVPLQWLVSLHGELLSVPNSWRFPELDPVAELAVPYLSELESRVRGMISEANPEMADTLQSLVSATVVARAASRIVLEQKEARRRFWSGIPGVFRNFRFR